MPTCPCGALRKVPSSSAIATPWKRYPTIEAALLSRSRELIGFDSGFQSLLQSSPVENLH